MGSTKQYTPEYKAKLVVEVLKGESTISEIGGRESISPKQLGNWKHEFLDNAYRAFSVTKDERNAEAKAREAQQREQDLMAKIGQLTYELDWAKKNLRKISNREKKELIDEAEPKYFCGKHLLLYLSHIQWYLPYFIEFNPIYKTMISKYLFSLLT